MLRFLGQFQADFQLKSGWIEPLLVGGYAPFSPSGGQIDNITRKALMQEIIKGEKPTLNNLVTICSEENISRNSHRKIGYLG